MLADESGWPRLCWGSEDVDKDGLGINLSYDSGHRLVHGGNVRMMRCCLNVHDRIMIAW